MARSLGIDSDGRGDGVTVNVKLMSETRRITLIRASPPNPQLRVMLFGVGNEVRLATLDPPRIGEYEQQ